MSRAIQITAYGGPEQMHLVELEVVEPGPGEIRIRHEACGLNFIDVYQRTGLYQNPLPLTLGMEGAGIVEAVGPGVEHLHAGDRAAYASNPPGSYSERRVMPARNVVRLPDGIAFDTAAGMMLKGLTAQYLLKRTLPVEGLEAGDFVLFHAAAGGVGLIACQWARQITGGRGVKVVYDSIGKDTFERSLDCLRPFGLMASFGNASGPVPPFAVGSLGAKGSLYITRQTLFTHIATRESTQAMADELFDVVGSGAVKIRIDQRYALADVAQAHRDLEARKTTGSSVLLP